MTVPGKPGLVPIEIELVAGLAVGQRCRLGAALCAAGEDPHALRNAEVDLRGEAVSEVAGRWGTSARVEQIGDGLLNGGQLEAFNGAVFVAGDGAVVLEGPVDT